MVEQQQRPTSGSPTQISGILLAGGASRRMGGVNKAFLKIRGQTVVERAAGVLRSVFSEVMVITNSPDEYQFLNLPMFPDIRPGQGSLGGLYTGLSLCRHEYGFLAACDMPFLNRGLIRYMAELAEGWDVTVPRIAAYWEPLHAIYSRRCLPYIEELLDQGNLKIYDFFHNVRVREISEADLKRFDPHALFAINLNTPEDLEKARALADRWDVP